MLVLVQFIFTSGPVGYEQWAGIFAAQWMKFLTFVTILSLLYHAWIGIRDIWMDYIKPVCVRLTMHTLTAVWLVSCFIYSLKVVWGL